MSQMHGKQIKGTSILFDKIDPSTGQTLTLVGTTKIQQPQAPVVGDDLANKTYVDSIASGLDPKEAVNLATIAAITATYSHGQGGDGVGAYLEGTGALSVDGVAVSVGERLLIKDQSSNVQNGIYDVGTAGSNWILTRTLDFDGTPTNEVNGGEFTFVMSGNSLADTGWVVSAPSGVDAIVGTTSITWVQFSSAGVITAGTGLEQSGNAINFQTGDLSLTVGATNAVVNVDGSTIQTGASGIEVVNAGITSTQLASSVAGAGLTGGAGTALSVRATNGLNVDGTSDSVELGGALTKNTVVNGAGGLYDLTFNQLDTFNLTVGTGGGFASIITDNLGTGLQYAADYTSGFVNESLITKRYVDVQIATVPVGDITGVTAGAGLVGGGASGFITLDVAGGTGIGVNADDVYVDGAALSGTGITWNSSTGQFETTSGDITGVTAGAGLTGGGSNGYLTLTARATNGLNVDGTSDSVELGGTLTKNTVVDGDDNLYDLSLNGLDEFHLVFGTAGGFPSTITDNQNVGIQYAADYSAGFANESLITKRYVDTQISAIPVGDVTGVTAGAGISGGGATGFLQLDIELTTNGGLTLSASGDAGTVEVDEDNLNYTTIATNLAGTGLSQNGTVLDVDYGSSAGTAVEGNTSYTITAGDGLSGTSLTGSLGAGINATLTVNTSNGLNTSGDNVVLGGSMSTATDLSLETGGSLTFTDNRTTTTGVQYAADYSADFVPRSLVDKQYVDGVASGLLFHESAEVTTTDSLQVIFGTTFSYSNGATGIGATLTSVTNIHLNSVGIDGIQSLIIGDSILVRNETSLPNNGIYDITNLGATGSAPIVLTRRTDFDSPPVVGISDGIHDGDFVFVTEGTLYADTGWVQTTTWATSSVVGTDNVTFVQFSSAGVLTAGLGLSQNGNAFDVNTLNGLSITGDNVVLGGTLSTDTTIDGTGAFDLSFNNLDSFALGFDNGGTITDSSGASAGIVYAADYSSGFTNESLITKRYVDDQIATVPVGDITGVTAGTGLSGGGASGYVTLDVNLLQNGGLTFSGDNITTDYTSLSTALAGDGLVANGTTMDVVAGTGIGVNADDVYVDGAALSGTGITWNSSTGQFETIGDVSGVTAGAGISGGGATGFLQLDLELSALSGLTFSASGDSGTLEIETDASLTVNAQGQLGVVNGGDVNTVNGNAGLTSSESVGGIVDLDVELTTNGGLTFSAAGNNGTIEVDEASLNYTTIASNLQGNGLTANAGVLDVNVGDGLAIISDVVEVSLVSNSGLTFSAGAIDISLGNGLVINSGNIDSNSDGLMTGDLINTGIATGSTIQAALEAMDVTLGNVEVSEIISVDFSPSAAANFTSGINAVSSATFSQASDGDAWVFLNGASQVVGGTTASAWFFSGDGGTTANANKNPGIADQLIVNIDTLGFSISGSNNDDDIIEVKYDALS